MAIDHGRYKPTLTVAKERWPKRPRAIEVAVGEHLSAEAAIEAAFRVGVEWVQNYG